MKAHNSWKTTFSLTLMLWAFVLSKTLPSDSKAVFKIVVLYDWEIPEGKERIASINIQNITRFSIVNSKKFTVKIIVHSVKDLSPRQIDAFFCENIIHEGASAIALHTKDPKLTRYIAYLASYFWIPCIGSSTDDQLLSHKDVYRSFLRTSPSETQQFQIFLDFLAYTGNSQAFVIVSDDTSYGHALEFFSVNDYYSIEVVKVNRDSTKQPEIVRTLMRIKGSLANAVFLYCDSHIAKLLLWTAKDFRMYRKDSIWVVSENVVLDTDHLYMLPSRIYGFMSEGHRSVDQFLMERLEETLALFHTALSSSDDEELNKFARKRKNCTEMHEWENGKDLYRKLVTASLSVPGAHIQFNSQGDRVNFTHDILYLLEAVNYNKHWSITGKWIDGTLTLKSTKLAASIKSSRVGLPALRAAVVEYPPLTMKSKYDPSIGCTQGIKCIAYIDNRNYTQHCCYGLAIDILTYVKGELEFEPLVYFVRDGNYGAKNVTSNQWNGIVRDLIIGEADISIDLMTNEARSEVVDFSQRWTEAGLALLVRVGEKKVRTVDFAFLDPFTMELWLGMVGIVNIYLIALWIADRFSPYGCYATRQRDSTAAQVFDLDGSMWFSWGVCFDNQFVGDRPRSDSSKAMAVCLAMFALLCLTSYTANLTAHLVFDDTKPEITGIRDPKITAEDSKLTFGVVKSSFVDSYFELNKDPVMKSLFERMLTRNHLVKNFTDGVDRVNSSKLDIFISEILSLDYEVAKQRHNDYPRLQVVGAAKTFADTGYSYSFRKNSTWKPKFDLVINKMKAENKPSELYKKWVRAGEKLTEDIHDSLSFQSLSGVFIVGVALAILSFFFLILENKLFSMGFIYKHLSLFGNGETYERGRRRFSVEVHRKLLEMKRPDSVNNGSIELPDISNYLERTRKTRASLHGLYNPVRTKKQEDRGSTETPTDSVIC